MTERGGNQRPPSMAINTTTTLDSFGLLYRSSILVLPQTQNIAGGKISGFERKAFTRPNSPDSKLFGFKVPTLDSGFKISGDMTKPGCFYFGFVLLCVNGKTNPVLSKTKGPFLEGPEKFSHPESHGKISKLMVTELFYWRILDMNRGSPHTRSFRRMHFSVFRYRWTKNGFTGPKSFRDFRETGPRPGDQRKCLVGQHDWR